MSANKDQRKSAKSAGKCRCRCKQSDKSTSPESTTSLSESSGAVPAVQQPANCICENCHCQSPDQITLDPIREAEISVQTPVSYPNQTRLIQEAVGNNCILVDDLHNRTEAYRNNKPRKDSVLDSDDPVISGTWARIAYEVAAGPKLLTKEEELAATPRGLLLDTKKLQSIALRAPKK